MHARTIRVHLSSLKYWPYVRVEKAQRCTCELSIFVSDVSPKILFAKWHNLFGCHSSNSVMTALGVLICLILAEEICYAAAAAESVQDLLLPIHKRFAPMNTPDMLLLDNIA